MKKIILAICLYGLLGSAHPVQIVQYTEDNTVQKPMPFAFTENLGQVDKTVHYHLNTPKGNAFFKKDAIVYQMVSDTSVENIQINFLHSRPDVKIVAKNKLTTKMNFYIGRNIEQNITGAETFGALEYQGIFPKIDLLILQQEGLLKHEYRIQPGGSVQDICLQYLGIKEININSSGELEINTSTRTLKESAPLSYQWIHGKKQLVENRYVIKPGNMVGFETANYDSSRELIIDPSLIFSTYLGGRRGDSASDIAVDLQLNTYIVGSTNSTDFPHTPGAYDTEQWPHYSTDAFVSKLNPEGTELIFSTYLGGSWDDSAIGVAISWMDDSILVTGTTSGDFPTTPGVYDESFGGWGRDIFLAKFDFSGALIFSTLLGGEQTEYSPHVAVDGAGHIFVAGMTLSPAFPTTPDAFDPVFDVYQGPYPEYYSDDNVFVSKFDPSGVELLYSTFYGGWGLELGGLAVDFDGFAYISGGDSFCFPNSVPVTPDVYKTECEYKDGFLAKLAPDGTHQVFSTHLDLQGYDYGLYPGPIAVDAQGRTFIVMNQFHEGMPASSLYSYTIAFSADGKQKRWRHSLPGGFEFDTRGIDIAVDGRGAVYVLHNTRRSNLKVTEDAFQSSLSGESDLYIEKRFGASGDLIYASYMGGGASDCPSALVVDSFGSVYVAGYTNSVDFPTTDQSVFPSPLGQGDAFVARIRDAGPKGELSVNKTYLPFQSLFQGTASKSKNVFLKNRGQGVVGYQVKANQPWIILSRAFGSLRHNTDALQVTLDPSGLKSGVHEATVKISSADAFNSPLQIPVRCRIVGPDLRLSKKAFLFSVSLGSNNPPAQECRIRNGGPGKLTYAIAPQAPWLSTSRTQGISQGEWDKFKIHVNISGLEAGIHQGFIEVSALEIVNSPVSVWVVLNIDSQE